MAETCEQHRERLVRAARLGLGYVQVARDRGVPAPGLLSMRTDVAAAHAAEIQASIDGVVPHSEGALSWLGGRVALLEDQVGDGWIDTDDPRPMHERLAAAEEACAYAAKKIGEWAAGGTIDAERPDEEVGVIMALQKLRDVAKGAPRG